MTANSIKEAAIRHFADTGYEGTALSAIALDVGIKKQSIYSHFKNKDELFLESYFEILNDEKDFILSYFQKQKGHPIDEMMFYFLFDIKNRFFNDSKIKFIFRTGFLPPAHLHDKVMNAFYCYLDELEKIFIDLFADLSNLKVDKNEAAIAFLGLLDSLLIELVYSGEERFQRRLNSSWPIYWSGITS
ncbi:TetR/AcrR family transcriptional regulator [Metabacillus arenae]|uniref:TetR/AcrR family transcriptional regulator n=1 Tax=Metabacillus arenae TaxID=2771434 RepID=A0A926NFT4_9BACI|nr:TetR/AcrR family transcriptional regulator [Metabacillus arenae]MBD1380754.1 TetR/AcrR family transcriptional regulator [Metabacillus arenae]